MTLPEVLLWQQLRAATPRFRRQHPVGLYALDFYCVAAKLVVEVDGAVHNMGDHPGLDERRDAWLSKQGLTVVRLPATEVLRDPTRVAESLILYARELVAAPPPSASPPPPP